MVVVFPCALLSAFGRVVPVYILFAHAFAIIPGIVGIYMRIAYYVMTLTNCSREVTIAFGVFFPHPDVTLGRFVSIGPYSLLGRVVIGERTQIAGGVQIPSGVRQHTRDANGRLTDETREFTQIAIGPDCWIGASAIVLVNVGARSTVAAGAVVVKELPEDSIVGGNPAASLRKK